MKLFTLPNGIDVQATDQFQISDQRYPSGWLALASDADLQTANITVKIVLDPLPVPPSPSELAKAELELVNMTALRCFKAGVVFPTEWFTYTNTLRSIVRSNSGSLPPRPSYPVGT